jgi:hypothetical protein
MIDMNGFQAVSSQKRGSLACIQRGGSGSHESTSPYPVAATGGDVAPVGSLALA